MKKPAIILMACVLTACGGEQHEDIKTWMRESTKNLKGSVPPLPEVRPFPVVAYEAANLVSPFDPVKIEPAKKAEGVRGGTGPDLDRRREPLEAYPLESLQMVGSIARGSTVLGIVKADRAVHHVRVDNYVGQNFGRITAISETQISLTELVQDSSGDWVERASSLQLQEK